MATNIKKRGAPKKLKRDVKTQVPLRLSKNSRDLIKACGWNSIQKFVDDQVISLAATIRADVKKLRKEVIALKEKNETKTRQ